MNAPRWMFLGMLCIAAARPAGADDSKGASTSQSPGQGSEVIATLEGAPITASSLQREMLREGGHDPSRFDELDEKRAALDAVIRIEVLSRAAIETGLDKDPELLDEYKRLLAQRFWSQRPQCQRQAPATEPEMERYYTANRSRFEQPVQVRGAIVLLRARVDATPEARKALRAEADRLASEVSGGHKKFADLARERSDDAFTKPRGGDIGWVTPGQRMQRWDEKVLNALAKIDAPSPTPRVVETEGGVYLVQQTERRGGTVIPLERVRKEVSTAVVAQRQRECSDAEYAALRSRYQLEIDSDALKRVAPPQGIVTPNGPPSFPVGRTAISPQTEGVVSDKGASR